VQLITTNEMRGRVMSVYNFAFRGGMPWEIYCQGGCSRVTAPVVLGVNGLLLVGLALYFLLLQRSWRRFDETNCDDGRLHSSPLKECNGNFAQ